MLMHMGLLQKEILGKRKGEEVGRGSRFRNVEYTHTAIKDLIPWFNILLAAHTKRMVYMTAAFPSYYMEHFQVVLGNIKQFNFLQIFLFFFFC